MSLIVIYRHGMYPMLNMDTCLDMVAAIMAGFSDLIVPSILHFLQTKIGLMIGLECWL